MTDVANWDEPNRNNCLQCQTMQNAKPVYSLQK